MFVGDEDLNILPELEPTGASVAMFVGVKVGEATAAKQLDCCRANALL